MFQMTYRILYTLFCLYTFWYTTSYAVYEIKEQKNKSGGICVVVFTLFAIAFSAFLIWQV